MEGSQAQGTLDSLFCTLSSENCGPLTGSSRFNLTDTTKTNFLCSTVDDYSEAAGRLKRNNFSFASWFTPEEYPTPETNSQTRKFIAIESEADCSSHHQEPDYQHHKHYIHCAHIPNVEDSMFASQEETHPGMRIRHAFSEHPEDLSESVPHFKDNYPHFHHHFHHHHHHHHHHQPHHHHNPYQLMPNSTSGMHRMADGDLSTDLCDHLYVLNLQDQEAGGCPSTADQDDDFSHDSHRSLAKLRSRVIDWLEGIQEHIMNGVVDDMPSEMECGFN